MQVTVRVAQHCSAAARNFEQLVVELRSGKAVFRAKSDVAPMPKKIDDGDVGGLHVGASGYEMRVRCVVMIGHADPALCRA